METTEEDIRKLREFCEFVENVIKRLEALTGGAPADVKAVASHWLENAIRVGKEEVKESGKTGSDATELMNFWKDSLSVYMEKNRNGRGEAWVIGDNYERSGNLIMYIDTGEWYYMRNYGRERLIKGGTKEAIANAKIIYTG